MPERPPEDSSNTVFLNIPYAREFRLLYFAYISGLMHLGLQPRATLEIPGARNRLDKIVELIHGCRYSIHDLSWVKLDGPAPRTPRFNMPFELGIAIAMEKSNPASHQTFVFEARKHRLAKSLSDLGGTDPYIHGRSPKRIMAELCNAFARRSFRQHSSVSGMMATYEAVKRTVPEIEALTASTDLFAARPFELLCYTARNAAESAIGY